MLDDNARIVMISNLNGAMHVWFLPAQVKQYHGTDAETESLHQGAVVNQRVDISEEQHSDGHQTLLNLQFSAIF